MEECLTTLPAPIQQVEIPEIFSVSQIVSADSCLLKVLLEMQGNIVGPLPSNPSVEIGKIFHSLLEEAVKSSTMKEEASLEGLEKMLNRLLDQACNRLKGNPYTAPFANLPQTMPAIVWERKRRSLLDASLELIDNKLHQNLKYSGSREKKFCFETMNGDGRWVEVPINVPDLRLKGRIDLLERKGNHIKIVDLKSGRFEGGGWGDLIEDSLAIATLWHLGTRIGAEALN